MVGGNGRADVTRVRRSGLAALHEGEWVVAARGSEAEFDLAAGSEQTVISYHFPVEIEVVVAAAATDEDQLVDAALGRLAQYLEGLA